MSEADEENETIEGAMAVYMAIATQEELACVINWDVSNWEPLKFVPVKLLKENLEKLGAQSDFHPIAEVIQKLSVVEVLMVYEINEATGTNFIICTTQDSVSEYQRREETRESGLLDLQTTYAYQPPQPKTWTNLGSDQEIENDWVQDSRPRIHLTIKLAPRKSSGYDFKDRNCDDVKDGYVSCLAFQDTTKWGEVRCMDRGMQAVPVLQESGTQTHLTHPKNVYIQYESRAFSEDEMKETMASEDFKAFLEQAEKLVNEAQEEGDIMGNIREEVEMFYMRDYVEERIEDRLVEHLSLSDLIFSRNKRVKAVEWHSKYSHIVAMSCIENLSYDDYMDSLTKRLLAPNYVMIWSTKHFIYPQLLLRCPDDVMLMRWHPSDPATLLGGLANGQIVIWDIQDWIKKLYIGDCTWDEKKMEAGDEGEEWSRENGFIPIIHWSAQTAIEYGHEEEVMDIKWIPRTIKFDQESSFPKENTGNVPQQFMSCGRENCIYIWQIDKEIIEAAAQSSLQAPNEDKKEEKKQKELEIPLVVKQVTGRYVHLEGKWKPMYKMSFIIPSSEEEILHPMCLQAFEVLDRADMIEAVNLMTGSVASSRRSSVSSNIRFEPPVQLGPDKTPRGSQASDMRADMRSDMRSSRGGSDLKFGSEMRGSEQAESQADSDKSRLKGLGQAVVKAIPTFIVGGTLQGAVFRANIAYNKIDSETGDLSVRMQWYKIVHDGPVNTVTRSPHFSDLILTVGGNLLIVWRETELTQPLIVKSSDQVANIVLRYWPIRFSMFRGAIGSSLTKGCWSLTRPSLVFSSLEDGTIQCWNLLTGGNSPVQQQNISGHTITCITGSVLSSFNGLLHCLSLPIHWNNITEILPSVENFLYNLGYRKEDEEEKDFLSIADTTGTIRLLKLPKHLYEAGSKEMEDTQEFTQRETQRLKFVRERAGGQADQEQEAAAKGKNAKLTKQQQKQQQKEKAEAKMKELQQQEDEGELAIEEPLEVVLYRLYVETEQDILRKVGAKQRDRKQPKPLITDRKQSMGMGLGMSKLVDSRRQSKAVIKSFAKVTTLAATK